MGKVLAEIVVMLAATLSTTFLVTIKVMIAGGKLSKGRTLFVKLISDLISYIEATAENLWLQNLI